MLPRLQGVAQEKVRRTAAYLDKRWAGKAIREGTTGIVEGWVDSDCRKVLVKVLVQMEGGQEPREVLHETFPKHIGLTREHFKRMEALLGNRPPGEGSQGPSKKRVPDWLLDGLPDPLAP